MGRNQWRNGVAVGILGEPSLAWSAWYSIFRVRGVVNKQDLLLGSPALVRVGDQDTGSPSPFFLSFFFCFFLRQNLKWCFGIGYTRYRDKEAPFSLHQVFLSLSLQVSFLSHVTKERIGVAQREGLDVKKRGLFLVLGIPNISGMSRSVWMVPS